MPLSRARCLRSRSRMDRRSPLAWSFTSPPASIFSRMSPTSALKDAAISESDAR